MALPTYWSQQEFDDFYLGLVTQGWAAYDEVFRTRSPTYLQTNVNEWLTYGVQTLTLPVGWSSLEFTDYMAALRGWGLETFNQYVLSRTPQDIMADTVARLATADRQADQWAGDLVARGGTISGSWLTTVETLTKAWQADGSYVYLDDFWLPVAENLGQAMLSLKQRRLATVMGAPVFTPKLGVAFDGIDDGWDTGFICNTHCKVGKFNNARIAVYDRGPNIVSNNYQAGAISTVSRSMFIRSRISTGLAGAANSGGGVWTLPVASSQGYSVITNRDGTIPGCLAYKSGVELVRVTDPAGFGATLPLVSMYIGGYNNAGVLTLPRACTVGALEVGASFTGAPMELSHYTALQAFMTTAGAAVVPA